MSNIQISSEQYGIIFALRSSGKTIKEICAETGLSGRQVQRVCIGVDPRRDNKIQALKELLADPDLQLKTACKKWDLSRTVLSQLLINFRMFLGIVGLNEQDYPRWKPRLAEPKPRKKFEWTSEKRRKHPWIVVQYSQNKDRDMTIVSHHKTESGAKFLAKVLNGRIIRNRKKHGKKPDDILYVREMMDDEALYTKTFKTAKEFKF